VTIRNCSIYDKPHPSGSCCVKAGDSSHRSIACILFKCRIDTGSRNAHSLSIFHAPSLPLSGLSRLEMILEGPCCDAYHFFWEWGIISNLMAYSILLHLINSRPVFIILLNFCLLDRKTPFASTADYTSIPRKFPIPNSKNKLNI